MISPPHLTALNGASGTSIRSPRSSTSLQWGASADRTISSGPTIRNVTAGGGREGDRYSSLHAEEAAMELPTPKKKDPIKVKRKKSRLNAIDFIIRSINLCALKGGLAWGVETRLH